MVSLFPRASLQRSSRTRTRKHSISTDAEIVCAPVTPPRSSSLVRQKTRPPPLQIIPELSENELDINGSPTYSQATARPANFPPQQLQLESSRITLSAYTFSIDDALLIFGSDTPRSPALSASSSTTDGASSEGIPTTPVTSDDEGDCDPMFLAPRSRPQPLAIRPLCIAKARSSVFQEDDDNDRGSEKEEAAFGIPLTEVQPEDEAATAIFEESEQDFYTHEFGDFISLSPVSPSDSSPARRDSLILDSEVFPIVAQVLKPKSRGRSRHSKPLPLLPPVTPPLSSFPGISALVQTTAHTSVVRRKRNVSSLPNYTPSPPAESRPLPRTAVPEDVEDGALSEDGFDIPSHGMTVGEEAHDVEEGTTLYSPSSLIYPAVISAHLLAPAIPETPLVGMYGEVALPRSSTDSDGPRSSIDSAMSFASSSPSDTPLSPFSFPSTPSFEDHEFEATDRLRSRWSSSTLGSMVAEQPRTTLLTPLRNVLGSRVRRVPLQKAPPQTPLQPTPSKSPKNKQESPATPSPPSTPEKRARRHRSQASTSSAGSSECGSHDGSPSGRHRKPIPMLMFLRAS